MNARFFSGAICALVSAAIALIIGLHYEALREVEIGAHRLIFLFPQRLVFLAVVPWFVWVTTQSLSDFSRWQQWLATTLRALAAAALIFALARPGTSRTATHVSATYLVDVSDSITDEALRRVQTSLQQAWSQLRSGDEMQIVTFAKTARLMSLDSHEKQLPPLRRHEDGSESNLQAAAQLSYGLFHPGYLRRAAYVSDGNQTAGNLLEEVDRARRFHVKMFEIASRQKLPSESAIRELEIPNDIRVGEPFRVRATLFASQPTKARVRLFQGATINGLDGVRDVELNEGETTIEFRSVVHVPGPVTYRAELEPQKPDRFAQNNHFETTVLIPGPPNVLYIEPNARDAAYLSRALIAADMAVEVRPPEAIPLAAKELERFDFVILSDTPADRVSSQAVEALARYVKDSGGGLIAAGGEHSFGLGGWRGTRLEEMLPVRMDAERRRDQPSLALVLVIDKSGSMREGQKLELAKEAARATSELLGADDYIEVIGFDAQPERVVRMQSAAGRMHIIRDIGRLSPEGGTAIFPAMDAAYQDLAVTRARIKHVILLTDGQSPEDGVTELVKVMRSEDITVSTVGLGSDVNRVLLQSMADFGSGRAYFTQDPHNIPRIFTKETTTVARSGAVEDMSAVVLQTYADFLKGIDVQSAPFLHGYVATQVKPHPAQLILRSELGEPLLARWRYGLGWSLAWTSDVKNRWAVDWLRWPGFSQFWAQLAREHMRHRSKQVLRMEAEALEGEARIVVDAIDSEDHFLDSLDSTLTVEGPGESKTKAAASDKPKTYTFQQTAPGRYEVRVPLPDFGPYVFHAVHKREGQAMAESTAHLSYPYPREYAPSTEAAYLIGKVATLTGGASLGHVQDVYEFKREPLSTVKEIWPPFLFAALALYILDLFLRRVRMGRLVPAF